MKKNEICDENWAKRLEQRPELHAAGIWQIRRLSINDYARQMLRTSQEYFIENRREDV
ncbi:hypothetical protein SAMN04515617_102204 [Collimonas sp. OK242]|jgi:hypothetical protein|uniref:hypothetical protein n=1 Tax=Collimonas sp. OK242 TaxID=1798195 RepID=UPI00089A3B8E|nr:hypothetical protein [Collimonas sp. OK242]SDX25491.1 hypothetical protein SAMN04515617_102204 [Collimonas sp. OK242]